MGLSDYHIHTCYSFDSEEKISNICEKAIQCGISEIMLTDHAEIYSSTKSAWPDFQTRSEDIEACSRLYNSKLRIGSGIEIGQIWRNPKMAAATLSDVDFDYVLSSVHELDGFGNPRNVEIDELNYHDFVREYFDCLKKSAESGDYDCLSHITYLYRFVPEQLAQQYPPEFYLKEYAGLFEILAGRSKGIEINCSGLRMPTIKKTLPSIELVRLFRECGGEIITIGSDGHSLRSVFLGLQDGYSIAFQAGFKKVAHYYKRNLYFEEIQ